MRILFFHNTATAYRIPLFIELAKKSDVKFIFTDMQLNKKIYNNSVNYEKLKDLDYIELSYGIEAFKEIKKIFVEDFKNIDIVELPPLDSLSEYIKGVYIYLLAKRKNIRIVYFWEKWEAPKDKMPLKRRLKNYLLKSAGQIIFKNVDICFAPGSKAEEYFINAGVQSDRVKIMPDACEVEECEYENLREKYGIEEDKKVILYFGRIIKQKGLDYLLKAYSQLPINIQDNFYLLIVGDGDFKEYCENLSDTLRLQNIKFVGSVNPQYRYLYFSQCDIFVHPGTFYEGRTDVWGLTINEALQFGKVIISTNAVGSAYDLINENNGFMVEESNVDELRQAIINISNHNIDFISKIESDRLKKIYSYENMANAFLNNVSKLL
ncbi:hypothetical protein HMPREF1084_03378 [Clostridium butyricum 60E.3]|uniref:glycosyltransferase family 4 protein n=1 Tax=Clostridium butyricum TaxID=1492 RepID=UPI0002D1F8B1|nr:glycosyltransferase [Clostridium butyricum]ENZ30805.1 hypothetical protein HMPREF1084_03378 [Clostridium butyricum 60E.3]